MAYKNKEDQQKAWKEHYQRNTQKYLDRARQRKVDIRDFINSLKEDKTCNKCQLQFPPKAMDFHHRDAATKEFSLANAASKGCGRERILREIAKCDLLCSNCHRIIGE